MYLPLNMPGRPIRSDQPIYAVNANVQSLSPQGDPFHCALCCSGKAGFAACVALHRHRRRVRWGLAQLHALLSSVGDLYALGPSRAPRRAMRLEVSQRPPPMRCTSA